MSAESENAKTQRYRQRVRLVAERRRIVPDTSVVVAAHFSEKHTKAAKKLVDAIEKQRVNAFAPHQMLCEFVKTAAEKCSRRQGNERITREDAEQRVFDFFDLRVQYVRETDFHAAAWDLMQEIEIAPPNAWMLACAIYMDAELWVSHDHADGFVRTAKKHHDRVFTLAGDPRKLP